MAKAGPSGELCRSNPSFEGTAGITFAQPDVPPWVACDTGAAFANVWNATLFYGIAPSDGSTYIRLASDASTDAGIVQASLSEPLCSTLAASTTYALDLDVAL